MIKFIPLIFFAAVLTACKPSATTSPAPEFNMQPHVSACLPALYAFDTLAQQYSGDQIGTRLHGAPWLRITRYDQHLMTSRALNASTLGAVLLPMQYNALAALRIEQQAIPSRELQIWQSQYSIKDTDHFLGYCSGEAVFAQLRDSSKAIAWLNTIAAIPLTNIADTMATTAIVSTNAAEQGPWQSYTLEKMPQRSAGFAKNTLGLPILGPDTEQELLRRYAPTFNISTRADSLKPSTIEWQGKRLQTTATSGIYGFIDTGFWKNNSIFRLHYVTWFGTTGGSALTNTFITRISILNNGKPIAVETMRLNGSQYQIHTPKHLKLSNVPEEIAATTTALAPKMAIYLSGSPLSVSQVARLSGSSNIQTFSLQRFDHLYGLTKGQQTHSIFTKNGRLAQASYCLDAVNALFGVKTVFGKALGQHLISATPALYFDDPVLLDKLGLGTVNR